MTLAVARASHHLRIGQQGCGRRRYLLQIERSEFLAVVGESGSGKTAAARAVLGLLPPGLRKPAAASCSTASISRPPRPARCERCAGPTVGMVFQEPMVSLNPRDQHRRADGRGAGAA